MSISTTMYQAQESPLQGAYYGPPIPPQVPYNQRPQRSCFCCLLSTLIKSLIAFCVVLGVLILVLWLVFRPHKIQVTVENASLTRFNLTSTSSGVVLDYSLATNISMRNPNRRIGVHYDWLEADAYYGWARFAWVELPAFYQGHKNTTVVSPLFRGSSVLVNGDAGRGFNGSGFFSVDVWLYARVRYKFGSLITRRYVARVKCGLGLKLVSNATENSGFTPTGCDVVDF